MEWMVGMIEDATNMAKSSGRKCASRKDLTSLRLEKSVCRIEPQSFRLTRCGGFFSARLSGFSSFIRFHRRELAWSPVLLSCKAMSLVMPSIPPSFSIGTDRSLMPQSKLTKRFRFKTKKIYEVDMWCHFIILEFSFDILNRFVRVGEQNRVTYLRLHATINI